MLKFSVQQIVEPLQLLQARPTWQSWSSLMNAPPLLPLDDDLIDHYRESLIEWHQIIDGNRSCMQSLQLRGVGSGLDPSSPPSCMFPFLAWWLSNLVSTPLSSPTITRHLLFHAYRPLPPTTSVQQGIPLQTRRYTTH